MQFTLKLWPSKAELMEALCEWCLFLSVVSWWGGGRDVWFCASISIFFTFYEHGETEFFDLALHVLVTAISDTYIYLLDNLVITATSYREKVMINKAVKLKNRNCCGEHKGKNVTADNGTHSLITVVHDVVVINTGIKTLAANFQHSDDGPCRWVAICIE